jgi:16S rRNA (cytosine967-C5)-methyltransferase
LRKAEKLPLEMLLCLDQALYSLAFLRMPDRAAVHWAMEHVRHRFGQGLGKVANGALRSMQRELAAFLDRDGYAQDCGGEEAALACWFSMPLWIVRLWRQAYGPDKALVLLEASAASPPQGIRLNRARAGWEALRKALLREHPEGTTAVGAAGLVFAPPFPPALTGLLTDGRASGQSGASYAALEYFRPSEWPQAVWDCCAGRGGKTLTLLEQGLPVALASDPSGHRLRALPREYARLGLNEPPCPRILEGSATEAPATFSPLAGAGEGAEAAPLPEHFGTILVDAPCSGLGTLGKRPEIRYRRNEADVARLAATQQAILDAVWPRLRPGGRLVYLTCTASPAENEEQATALLRRHPDASLVDSYDGGELASLGEYFYGALFVKE